MSTIYCPIRTIVYETLMTPIPSYSKWIIARYNNTDKLNKAVIMVSQNSIKACCCG